MGLEGGGGFGSDPRWGSPPPCRGRRRGAFLGGGAVRGLLLSSLAGVLGRPLYPAPSGGGARAPCPPRPAARSPARSLLLSLRLLRQTLGARPTSVGRQVRGRRPREGTPDSWGGHERLSPLNSRLDLRGKPGSGRVGAPHSCPLAPLPLPHPTRWCSGSRIREPRFLPPLSDPSLINSSPRFAASRGAEASLASPGACTANGRAGPSS